MVCTISLSPWLQYSRPDGIPPHHLVLDFAPGQTAYDVAAMESPAEHPSLVQAHERRTAGPVPVTLISCLEARNQPGLQLACNPLMAQPGTRVGMFGWVLLPEPAQARVCSGCTCIATHVHSATMCGALVICAGASCERLMLDHLRARR